ncbi:MAG: hypothetical protein K0R02_104 [Rickettsiaceae bacterium]|jgi:hypothetical protein|nr:hypothetical protein [Rickettsiaceae bacterium]
MRTKFEEILSLILKIIICIALIITAYFIYRNLTSLQKKYLSLKHYKKVTENSVFYLPLPSSIPLEHLSSLDLLNKNSLAIGKEEMKRHKIVISGIARDNSKDLPVMMKHIEHIGNAFADYRVVIFENDSVDGTKAILHNWKTLNKRVNIQAKDFKNTKRPNIKFMADIRNRYLDTINADPKYKEFDLLMVIDMDMSYGIDIRALQDSFSKFNRWDAVCSNGISNKKGEMYDMFAFRNEEFPWKPEDAPITYGSKILNKGQRAYPINSDLIPVDSCFGGMALYKRNYIKGCKYDSINNDCEHIHFHQCIKEKNNGKMFMNPSQVIRYSHYNDAE